MNSMILTRKGLLLGVLYLAIILGIGTFVAVAQGDSPVSAMRDLFTDPIWLFVLVFSFFMLFRSYRYKVL